MKIWCCRDGDASSKTVRTELGDGEEILCRSEIQSGCTGGYFFEANVVDAICKVCWRTKEHSMCLTKVR